MEDFKEEMEELLALYKGTDAALTQQLYRTLGEFVPRMKNFVEIYEAKQSSISKVQALENKLAFDEDDDDDDEVC